MKNHKTIWRIVSILILLIAIISCQQDDSEFIENSNNESSAPIIEVLDKATYSQNQDLLNSIQEASSKLQPQQFSDSETASIINFENSNYNYTVLSETVTHLIWGDYESYVFPLLSDRYNDSTLENLLISHHQGQEYEVSIVTYHITAEQRVQITHGESPDVSDYMEFTALEDFDVSTLITTSQDQTVYYDEQGNYCYVLELEESGATGWDVYSRREVPCTGEENADHFDDGDEQGGGGYDGSGHPDPLDNRDYGNGEEENGDGDTTNGGGCPGCPPNNNGDNNTNNGGNTGDGDNDGPTCTFDVILNDFVCDDAFPLVLEFSIDTLIDVLEITDQTQIDYLEDNIRFSEEIFDFLVSDNFSDEIEDLVRWLVDEISNLESECGSGQIKDSNGDCVDNPNPILGADCRSFEYAQPPGTLLKGCAVENFDHNFYFAFIDDNGSFQAGFYEVDSPLVYFTMPPGMTNGRAANLTAIGVTAAIKATDVYAATNQNITVQNVGNYFINSIRTALGIYGGNITQTAPFTIPSPAPYITNLLGAQTDCE